MEIQFTKLVGSGNDFILVDNRTGVLGSELLPLINRLCERRSSVGADGFLLLEGSELHSFSMRYFNADGSEAEMCGNGGLCIALYAYRKGIAPQEMVFSSRAGVHTAQVCESSVRLKFTEPKGIRLNVPLNLDGREHNCHLLNSGVPHAVLFADDVDEIEVEKLGRKIRSHPVLGPEGANVDFVKVLGGNEIRVRTYERGVEGETLSCGTGAVASAIISCLSMGMKPPVGVSTQGGLVKVDFRLDKDSARGVWLEGGARIAYEGRVEI